MVKSLLRTDKEIAEIYECHKLTVYRVCFAFMKNSADTEDVVQDTFFQLIKTGTVFESEEHEKAWLIRTATNLNYLILHPFALNIHFSPIQLPHPFLPEFVP